MRLRVCARPRVLNAPTDRWIDDEPTKRVDQGHVEWREASYRFHVDSQIERVTFWTTPEGKGQRRGDRLSVSFASSQMPADSLGRLKSRRARKTNSALSAVSSRRLPPRVAGAARAAGPAPVRSLNSRLCSFARTSPRGFPSSVPQKAKGLELAGSARGHGLSRAHPRTGASAVPFRVYSNSVRPYAVLSRSRSLPLSRALPRRSWEGRVPHDVENPGRNFR
jgi:hypothetical protein